MQLRLVQGSQASRRPGRGEPVAVVLLEDKPPAPLSWTASFVASRRTQLAVLARSAVTAGLRAVAARETCLASVWRRTYPRLVTEALEPARAHALDRVADEGGIYSW